MDNEVDAKRQSAQDPFFPQDQYKSEWNESWRVGFKAGDFLWKVNEQWI